MEMREDDVGLYWNGTDIGEWMRNRRDDAGMAGLEGI